MADLTDKNRPLSMLSNSSSCLPAYQPPLYAEVQQPKTPPASVYSPESIVSTPVMDRSRGVSQALAEDEDEEDEAGHVEGGTGLPSELDCLIAQTAALLESTTECLRAGLEAREQLKRFQALDELVDRHVYVSTSNPTRKGLTFS